MTNQSDPDQDPDAATLPPAARAVSDHSESDYPTLAPPATGDLVLHGSASQTVKYFGDYELLSEIARGGMGVVYKARQVNLNRLVALKMILAGQLASEEDVKRFYTEAEAAAALEHPGIVPIFEIGQHNDQHFFSMGFVDGGSLADKIKDGPLPSKEAASYTKKVAEAIAYAHSKGVIHRDLKPANVLLDRNDEPKVTDFGLARRAESNSDLTRTGAVMGTPSYMPPEQASGKTDEVGPLADVYSLGAIFYCLLTGRPPFQASNPLDTLMQVIEREPVSVSTLNPATPRDLETICHKCLQKDPAKRYASAQDFADDLGRWLKGEPITARAVSKTEKALRWVQRNKMVSGLLTATTMAILVGSGVSIALAIVARQEAINAKIAEQSAEEFAEEAHKEREQARMAAKEAEESAAQAEEQREIAEKERQIAKVQEEIAMMNSERAEESERESRVARTEAEHARNLAEEAEKSAIIDREKAVELAENIRRQQRLQAVERAGDYLTQDDWYGAHFWFTQAIPPESPANKNERDFALRRLNVLWDRLPLATHFWQLPSRSVFLDVSADESSLVAVDVNHDAYVFKSETGEKMAGPFHQQTPIWAATVDPSRDLMVTVGGALGISGEMSVWDIAKGERVTAGLNQPLATFFYAQFVEGGKQILTADLNVEGKGEMKVWDLDLKSRRLKRIKTSTTFFPGSISDVSAYIDSETGNVLSYERHPTNPLLAPIRVVHSVSGKTVGELDASKRFANMRASSNYAKFILNGSLVRMFVLNEKGEWCVHLWDPSGVRTLFEPMVLTQGEPTQVWLVEDSDLAVVKTTARRHLIYSTSTGLLQWQLNASDGTEGETVPSSDGRFAAIPLIDGRVQVWDVLTNRATSAILRHGESLTSMFFDKKGRRLITGTKGGAIRIWDFATTSPMFGSETPNARVWAKTYVKGLSDGEFAVTSLGAESQSSQEPWVQYWKRDNGGYAWHHMALTIPNANNIAFSESEIFAVANAQARIDVGNILSKESKTINVNGDGKFLRQLKLSRDGKLLGGLLSKSDNGPTSMLGELSVWDTSNSKRIHSGIQSSEPNLFTAILPSQIPNLSGIICFAFDVKGERIAIGCGSASTQGIRGETKIIDARSGKILGKSMAMSAGNVPLFLEFHPSQNSLVVAGGSPASHEIEFSTWNLDTAEQKVLVLGSGGKSTEFSNSTVAPMKFSPDGRLLAIASENQLELFEGKTFQRYRMPMPHPTRIESIVFHPNLPLIATKCHDQTIRVWDTATGNLFTSAIETAGSFSSIDFTNSDLLVAAEMVDGRNRVRTWNFQPEVLPLERHQQIAIAFTGLTNDGSAVEHRIDSTKMQRDWSLIREAFPTRFQPNEVQVVHLTGLIADDCERRKMRSAAISYLLHLAKEFPGDAYRLRRIAVLYGDEGKYELAAEHFERCNELLAAKNEFNDFIVFEEITSLLMAGKEDEYVLACEAAVNRWKDADRSFPLERIAKTCFLHRNCPVDLKEAVAMSERALELDHEKPEPGLRPLLELCLGMGQFREGKFESAISTLKPVVEHPTLVPVFQHLARAFVSLSLIGLDRKSEAREYLQPAIEFDRQFKSTKSESGSWLNHAHLSIAIEEARSLVE
jgi:WD40 repeat protein/tRNA A-37 threonylcarbamoyl transferase component Bud32/tetratricopeptide (TPR) repeat protein